MWITIERKQDADWKVGRGNRISWLSVWQKWKNGSSKAYNHLEERLEECWLQNPELPIEEKMRACKEIIGGWEQYYRGDRTPGSIYEYVTVLSLYPKARRKELENENKANFTEIM